MINRWQWCSYGDWKKQCSYPGNSSWLALAVIYGLIHTVYSLGSRAWVRPPTESLGHIWISVHTSWSLFTCLNRKPFVAGEWKRLGGFSEEWVVATHGHSKKWPAETFLEGWAALWNYMWEQEQECTPGGVLEALKPAPQITPGAKHMLSDWYTANPQFNWLMGGEVINAIINVY